MSEKEDLYKRDGVNVKEGDSFSECAGKLCWQTYGNSPYVEVDSFSGKHFRGPRGFRLNVLPINPNGLPEGYLCTCAPDGIGTKVAIIDASGLYANAARNLVAMCAGDITRWGGLPLVFTSILDTKTLGENGDETNMAFRAMIRGLKETADQQEFVMLNGETAELPTCVSSDNPDACTQFNWGGVMFGVYHRRTIITGNTVAPGQVVVALREKSFRCNGISSVRRALAMKFGEQWWANPEAKESIQAAAEPAVLYDRFLAAANGWHSPDFSPVVKAHLIVHVTGGAIQSKLAEDILFPQGLSATLGSLWVLPQIMRDCAGWRGMDSQELYKTWNGGQGVLMVVDASDVGTLTHMASKHGIEAKACGEITKEKSPRVTIVSQLNGEEITFEPKT